MRMSNNEIRLKRGGIMKNRSRKWLLFMLVLLLALPGCAREEVPEEPEIVVEEVPEQEEVIEEIPEVPLSVYTDTKHKTYYFEESDQVYLYLQYCDVTLEGSGFENLKRNVENWSLERSGNLRSIYSEYEKNVKADAEEKGDRFQPYVTYQTVAAERIDERVLSLLEEVYDYSGEGEGTVVLTGVNFDAQTGRSLTLKDILVDAAGFAEEAKGRIISELQELYGEELSDGYEQAVADLWLDEKEPEWYLDASGIVIIIPQYAVGDHYVGTPKIHMPYGEFERYIKAAYLPAFSTGVAHIEKNEELYLELPDKEEAMPLMLQFEWEEYETNCALWLGEDKTSLSDFATMEDAYLIRNGEEVYCLVELDMASDDYITYVFRLTNGAIDEVAEVTGAIDAGNVNAHQVMIESWVNMLGTYGGVKTYRFDEEQGFTTEDQEYRLLGNEQVLTTTADLPVMLGDMESTLPAGSHIVLNATDDESYVTFTIQETGQTGRLQVERNKEEFQVMVYGISEYDCFEMLPYAG